MERRTFLKGAGLCAGATVLKTTGAPMVWAQGKSIHWRMATSWPADMSILQTGAKRFAQQVHSMSQGRLNIEVFAAGELVGALDVFEAVSENRVQCGNGASYYWASKIPAAQWFTTVPFGLKAQDLNTWISMGGGYELWQDVYAPYNVIPMLSGNTGVQMGGWFNREIKSIEDFKELKMRIPGLGGKVIKKLGAKVILLPAGEIYQALASGRINAIEWIGPYHDMQMGFHRIAKYYYAPGWHEPGTAFEMIFSRPAYESLPTDLKDIIKAAVSELNNRILAEFEYHNAQAMLQIARERKVSLRQFPLGVIRTLERMSADVLEIEADKNPQAKIIHEAFKRFKKEMSTFSLLKGAGVLI